jgi:thiosulfate reductase cytochrome b subunit
MIGVQIALPFLLRKIRRAPISPGNPHHAILQTRAEPPAGKSMRWHYALGFVLPAAALAHGWIPMASGHMPRTSMTGLWLATFALGLLFLQLLIGLAVQTLGRNGESAGRLALRRTHFVTMLLITSLALAHMLLN